MIIIVAVKRFVLKLHIVRSLTICGAYLMLLVSMTLAGTGIWDLNIDGETVSGSSLKEALISLELISIERDPQKRGIHFVMDDTSKYSSPLNISLPSTVSIYNAAQMLLHMKGYELIILGDTGIIARRKPMVQSVVFLFSCQDSDTGHTINNVNMTTATGLVPIVLHYTNNYYFGVYPYVSSVLVSDDHLIQELPQCDIIPLQFYADGYWDVQSNMCRYGDEGSLLGYPYVDIRMKAKNTDQK